MNILLINHYAGSPKMGMEYRPYYLAKEWINKGHKVVIIAADNAHVRKIQPKIPLSFSSEIIDGIEYLWVKTPEYQGNGIARVKNMFSFIYQLKRKASFLAKKYRPDIVIASSTYPLDNYPAHKIAKLSGAIYLYEIHDLWPLSPMELGGMKWWHPFILWMQKAENYAYKHADQVISMLPKTQEHTASHGLDLKKWHYIPNGLNLDEWEKPAELNHKSKEFIHTLRSDYKNLVAYTGSFGIANALESFIQSADFVSPKDIALILVGQGPEKQNLMELATKYPNIYFMEPIPKNEIPSLLSQFDILFIGLQRQKLFRFGISPNKLFDYMMAGKPVIQAIEAGNDMVKESGCGISVEPENPSAIAKAITELTQKSKEDLVAMGKKGKHYVTQNHDYKVLSDKFLDILNVGKQRS